MGCVLSSDALFYLRRLRGLRLTHRAVLQCLCEHHTADFGCFPRQSTICEEIGVSRSSLNTYLADLERLGRIRRVQRRDPRTNRQQSTRYILWFEPEFAQGLGKPSPKVGHGNPKSRVQNLDSGRVQISDSENSNTDNKPTTTRAGDRARHVRHETGR